MGMVVRTNTMALNAYRQLGLNNSAVSKSLEKLASGYRINRAGDDAAGLAISEKMKAQITGLETASSNAQDGISLIQTAEGNLGEVHDMLNRMVELATKSANGTYTSQERDALQAEVSQLLDEIDRISQSANFNGAKLLDGTMGLNNEAFKIGESSAYVPAGTSSLADKVTVPQATHSSLGATEVKPKFTVDFAEYEVSVAATDATAKGKVGVDLSIGTETIKVFDTATTDFKDLSAVTDTAIVKEGAGAGDAGVIKGSDIADYLDGKTVQIGNDAYKATKSGTEITFEFQGKADKDGTNGVSATDVKVDGNTFTPKGNLTITAKALSAGGQVAVKDGVREDCPVYDITDPVVGADKVRAGARLTLDTNIVKDGAKLMIGVTEFTFDASVDAASATGNTIGIKDLTGSALLQSVTQQLSSKTATIKDEAGNSFTFNIGRGADLTSIEIEEDVPTAAGQYGGFTEKQLKDAFSVVNQEAMANVKFQIVDNDKMADTETITVDGKKIEFARGNDTADTFSKLQSALGTGYNYAVNGDTITISAKAASTATVADKTAMAAPVIIGSGLTLQIGDTADEYNKMTIGVPNMSAAGLGLQGLTVANQTAASNAIDTIKSAINSVSTVRANMGALQNRLEHTINNLDVAAENLSAANSRIRDTDMAKEMMNYTKMNVLVQSAQAMLAQANQQPQSVLQLLQ